MKRFLALMSAVLVLGSSAALVAGSIVINGKPAQAYPARECPCP
jgi:hypothetical protein